MNQKILTKKVISKTSVDSILRLQVMHDYVHWHISVDYCIKLIPAHPQEFIGK